MKSEKPPVAGPAAEALRALRTGALRTGVRRALLAALAVAATVSSTAAAGGAAGAASRHPAGAAALTPAPDGPWAGGQKISPPPDGPWPQGATFSVFLCKAGDPFENCGGRALTAKQRRALQARLEAMPEVGEVEFESRREAYENFKEHNADEKALISAISAEDIPESFRGTLHRRADRASFESAMEKTAGVSSVWVLGGRFWEGKADVRVTLCGKRDPDAEADDPCAGRGPATRRERDAVEAALSGMREVQQVYVEDAAHAGRVFDFWLMRRKSRAEAHSGSYYVRLVNRENARAVAGYVEAVPGVAGTEIVDAG
ncbi:permease-like cell division protein FtsX [Planomonospora sp. ID82291]|uniref:permease-like cell division protein FtsX n=1 Tax=Planomonospora sp. ID82291 TaxID=2738136 RepID=UPI0018C44D25|nr:permease-like cell division protein FtsX [Planomonospora sp. ID82291]MBG0813362.1 hypothetical protein [Planomonospora sp. ID82291]